VLGDLTVPTSRNNRQLQIAIRTALLQQVWHGETPRSFFSCAMRRCDGDHIPCGMTLSGSTLSLLAVLAW